MAFYSEYPHTRNYDDDLRELIARYKDLGKQYDDLIKIYDVIKDDVNSITLEQLQTWLEDGTLEDLINQSIILQYDSMVLNILNYQNLVPKENMADMIAGEWTAAIKQAIADASNFGESGKCPVIYFPWTGNDYITKPIDLTQYKNLTFVGGGATIHKNLIFHHGDESTPSKYVRIKFIPESTQNTGIGFKCASTENPLSSPDNMPHGFTFKNLWLYGNQSVQNCINGAQDIAISNCFCSHALSDGVVLEDYTFPCLIYDCDFGFNHGSGLYIRGPHTTVYSITEVNSNFNYKYGFKIEGGSQASFTNCLAQGNTLGGIYIAKRNDLYGSGVYYAAGLTFNNMYTEANGSNANDYALRIESIGSAVPNEFRNIVFNGGAINFSSPTKSMYLDAIYGLYMNNVQVDVSSANNTYGANGLTGMFLGQQPSYTFLNPINWYSSSARLLNGDLFKYDNAHFVSRKGQTRYITYFKTTSAASEDTQLPIVGNSGNTLGSGIPVENGSLIAIGIESDATQGKIRALPVSCAINAINSGMSYMPQEYTELVAPANAVRTRYNFLEIPLRNVFFGLRLQTYSVNVGCHIRIWAIVED